MASVVLQWRGEFDNVDFDPRLRRLYIEECGFKPTGGGLMELR